MTPTELRRLVRQGEGRSLEFKRTTGELREGLQTLCAFLNTAGGRVLFGVNSNGRIEGQHVSERTIHEITAGLQRFEPPAPVEIERAKVGRDREVISLAVEANQEAIPFSFDGRAFGRQAVSRLQAEGRPQDTTSRRIRADGSRTIREPFANGRALSRTLHDNA